MTVEQYGLVVVALHDKISSPPSKFKPAFGPFMPSGQKRFGSGVSYSSRNPNGAISTITMQL